ncbi:MAG: hypothetical protein ACK5NT_15230 [Pyrinomonadaceae bacterium]
MQKLPRLRLEGILEQGFDAETLLYDTKTDKAFSLNDISTKVYQHCDGNSNLDEVSAKEGITAEAIMLALKQFYEIGLVEPNNELENKLSKVSRRKLIRQAGIGGIATLPLIAVVVAPRAAQAASLLATGESCINNTDCMSGVCGTFIPGPPIVVPGFPIYTPCSAYPGCITVMPGFPTYSPGPPISVNICT